MSWYSPGFLAFVNGRYLGIVGNHKKHEGVVQGVSRNTGNQGSCFQPQCTQKQTWNDENEVSN